MSVPHSAHVPHHFTTSTNNLLAPFKKLSSVAFAGSEIDMSVYLFIL